MAPPPLLIRCDAGQDHGLGHLMRCLSLAESLRSIQGPIAQFLMQAPEDIRQRVRDAGFFVSEASTSAGADDQDCSEIIEWCHQNSGSKGQKPWVVIDGKYADPVALTPLAETSRLICYDDSPYRDFPAAVIINSQPWTSEQDYPRRAGRRILAGARYNALHPGYFAAADKVNRQAVLITMGGEDPANDTAWIARTLRDQLAPYQVLVVIGPAHPDREGACAAIAEHLPQAEIIYAPSSLVEMAERSFLALSAGGTSCYELQAAGVAVAALAVEEHQIPFIEALERCGGVVPLAGPSSISHSRPAEPARSILRRLLSDSMWRNGRVAKGKGLFPVPGGRYLAQRLIEILQ
ncbi:Spore coat polysaccharide biosynthesis protein SpsG, predicted glycosyltransferase [Thalassospira xiamenensis]|uniref:Spore coat polysaccharide biosynthesis protein SpsG, predicted glycosyltransferase n=1 Tax=Thalassospira xiamenensis TaxID=220697 RepID=A0A285U196_9PROT|nr:Spore coat polysaccharide biosynthesis protein SpsG, predicted glycosyltransferase [Thalassospira xiamenensis]